MVNIEERGKQVPVDGFAHEHIAAGSLMKRYQNVSLVDLPLSPYDIIIVRKVSDDSEDIIRARVKTATQSVSFAGGGRGELIESTNRMLKLIRNPLQPRTLLKDNSGDYVFLKNSNGTVFNH